MSQVRSVPNVLSKKAADDLLKTSGGSNLVNSGQPQAQSITDKAEKLSQKVAAKKRKDKKLDENDSEATLATEEELEQAAQAAKELATEAEMVNAEEGGELIQLAQAGTTATDASGGFGSVGGVSTGAILGGLALVGVAVAVANDDNDSNSSSSSDPVTPEVSTFRLTTDVDNIVGTSGNDSIFANFFTSNATLNDFDSINGGAGSDTLTIYTNQAFTALPVSASISNVENIVVLSSLGAVTLDTTTWGTTESVIVEATASAVAVTTQAASVSVTGGTTVAVIDTSTTPALTGSTLTSVTINGAADDQVITADGLTTLNLTNLIGATAVGDTTVTAKAGERALTVTYDGVDVGNDGAATVGTLTMTDAEATALNIKATGTKSFDVTTVTAKATAVTIDAAVDLQIDALTANVAKTVGISGAGSVTITADTLATDVVITSTNTGGVTITQALTANQQFVGTASSGNDSISIATTSTKAHTTGAGDDTVIVGGAFGSGGSVDAGDGIDTLSLTAALGASLSDNDTFEGTISGFERLTVGAFGDTAHTINLTNLDDINYVISAGGGAHARSQAISGFTTGGTFEQTALMGTANNLTLSGTGFAAGTADTFNFKYTAAAGFANAGTVTLANVETVNITTNDTAGAATVFTGKLQIAAATAVNVSGNAGFDFTGSNLSAMTKLDASGVTATGAGGKVTVTAAVAATLIGGAGDDALTGSSGADTITGGAGADVLTGGDGADTFVFAADDSDATDFDIITDFTIGEDDALEFLTAGTDVVADSSGDVNVAGATTEAADTVTATVTNGIITLAGGDAENVDTLAEWLAVANLVVLDAETTDNDVVIGFEFDGNTYLAEYAFDADASGDTATLLNLVQLTGVIGVTAISDTAAADTVLIA